MLPVTLAGVKLLCGIGDTSQDAGITALIALEQPALEYALDPAVLANAATRRGAGGDADAGRHRGAGRRLPRHAGPARN